MTTTRRTAAQYKITWIQGGNPADAAASETEAAIGIAGWIFSQTASCNIAKARIEHHMMGMASNSGMGTSLPSGVFKRNHLIDQIFTAAVGNDQILGTKTVAVHIVTETSVVAMNHILHPIPV